MEEVGILADEGSVIAVRSARCEVTSVNLDDLRVTTDDKEALQDQKHSNPAYQEDSDSEESSEQSLTVSHHDDCPAIEQSASAFVSDEHIPRNHAQLTADKAHGPRIVVQNLHGSWTKVGKKRDGPFYLQFISLRCVCSFNTCKVPHPKR